MVVSSLSSFSPKVEMKSTRVTTMLGIERKVHKAMASSLILTLTGMHVDSGEGMICNSSTSDVARARLTEEKRRESQKATRRRGVWRTTALRVAAFNDQESRMFDVF